MRVWQDLRRAAWPIAATAASVLVHMFYDRTVDRFGLGLEPGAARLVTGSVAYFAAAWLAGRLAGIALERAASGQRRVPKLLQELISAAFFVAALIATFMLILGHSISGALASSGLIIAVLGFAIRNVVADALSGVAIGLEAPYRIGDWVDIGGIAKGRIVEIGWRTTRLVTRDATYMILPNSQIAREKLTNYSAPRRHYRAQIQIMLSQDVPVESARKLLAEAASKPYAVLEKPAPDVRVLSYDKEGLVYAVRYWVPSFAEEIDCRDLVLGEIDKALREHNVLPPYSRVHLVRDDRVDARNVFLSSSLPPAVQRSGQEAVADAGAIAGGA